MEFAKIKMSSMRINPTRPTTMTTTAIPMTAWVGTEFSPSMSPHEDQFNICFSNIHGLRKHKTSIHEAIHDLVQELMTYKICMAGISEHNVAIRDPGIPEKIHKTILQMRCHHPIFFSLHSSSETSAGSGRLMGGTGITVLDDLVGRIEQDGSGGDPMGRWSYVHLRRPQKPPVTVISIYQVCQAPTSP